MIVMRWLWWSGAGDAEPCNVRKYDGKLLIKPSQSGVKAFLAKIRGTIRQNKAVAQKDLIFRLNPIIRGWVNFHRFNVSSKTFKYVDTQIYHALWKWAVRRHNHKGKRWIAKNYFHRVGNRQWTFSVQWKRPDDTTGYFALEYASNTKINRFLKLKDGANPYDTDWLLYFEERETDKMSVTVKGNQTLRKLYYQQEGKCALCGNPLTLESGARCHKYNDGKRTSNYLVHSSCHLNLHKFVSLQPAYYGSNRL